MSTVNDDSANDSVVEQNEIPKSAKALKERQSVSLSVFEYRLIVYLFPLVLLAGVAGNVYYTQKLLSDELVSRPPIAIMPVRDAILKRVTGKSNPKALDVAKDEVNAAAKKLKESGYVVLDADFVFAYPGDVEAMP